jgi:hypothetical protein
MSQSTINPAEIRAPAHLTRAEKAAFRRYVAALPARNEAFPIGFADDLADFVKARSRIAWLERMLRHETTSVPRFATPAALRLSAQLNAAVAVSQRLADRLRANGAPTSD